MLNLFLAIITRALIPILEGKIGRTKGNMNRYFLRKTLIYYFVLLGFLALSAFVVLQWNHPAGDDTMDFTNADNITGFPHPIVPNIVHMVHFGEPELNFGEIITIKSVHANHKPDKILIHCNFQEMRGKYWNNVSDIPGLELRYREQPTQIFGRNFSWIQHASDVTRLEVLMEYGGIYLDSDVYVVSSLDQYRHFEFAIGWEIGQGIGNQIMIAHKDARFLKFYYETYRYYNSSLWYYNGGELPTKSVLLKKPYLVHRVVRDFGVDTILHDMLYTKETSEEWRTFKCIHLLLRWAPKKDFDENNIKTYDRTFGAMTRLILFGSTALIK